MRSNCTVNGCDSQAAAHGYCKAHLYRWQRYGDPLVSKRTFGQLGWLKDQIANAKPDECIVWPFHKSRGYGHVRYQGSDVQAHRLALILFTGKDFPDLHAAHGPCHNRACVNPHHLSWLTAEQNNADKLRDGTYQGGVRHHATRLTEQDVLSIRARRSGGEIYRTIAADYGMTISAIQMICARKVFESVKG